jgi:hypothetical protein
MCLSQQRPSQLHIFIHFFLSALIGVPQAEVVLCVYVYVCVCYVMERKQLYLERTSSAKLYFQE